MASCNHPQTCGLRRKSAVAQARPISRCGGWGSKLHLSHAPKRSAAALSRGYHSNHPQHCAPVPITIDPEKHFTPKAKHWPPVAPHSDQAAFYGTAPSQRLFSGRPKIVTPMPQSKIEPQSDYSVSAQCKRVIQCLMRCPQEVPRTSERKPTESIYLWGVDMHKLHHTLMDVLYKATRCAPSFPVCHVALTRIGRIVRRSQGKCGTAEL